jgi:hypothetical protein
LSARFFDATGSGFLFSSIFVIRESWMESVYCDRRIAVLKISYLILVSSSPEVS